MTGVEVASIEDLQETEARISHAVEALLSLRDERIAQLKERIKALEDKIARDGQTNLADKAGGRA